MEENGEDNLNNKLKILIVDDNCNISEILKDILETFDFDIDTAPSGEEGVAMSRLKRYDLLFVDMMLPGMNGLETYLSIKESNTDLATVLITAHRKEMRSLVKESLNKGARACLYKPFDPQDVIAIAKEEQKKKILEQSEN